MKLKDIIQNCGVISVQGDPDLEITSLTNDSRRVQPGSLFIAVNGCGNDGRQYIANAIEAGAVAVLFEDPAGRSAGLPDGVPENLRFLGCRDGRPEIIFRTSLPKNQFPLRCLPARPSLRLCR